MVKLIYGMAGTGKSTLVYEQIVTDLKNGKRVLLLTPEQQAVLSEQAIAERTKDVSTLRLDILSFRRLANHVSRMYGGLRYRYLDDSGKYLVLWASLFGTAGLLDTYRKHAATDTGFLERLHATFSEFSHANILPAQLERAAEELMEEDPRIAAKLKDISLIYATYRELLHKEHDDPDDDLVHLAALLTKYRDSFAGYHIYIDSFQGYTEQELSVLRSLIPQAEDVTITLCYDPSLSEDMLATARKTDSQIKRILAACSLPYETTQLSTPHRFHSPAITHLATNLYRMDQATQIPCDGAVQVIACNTPMAEAEAVAREIIKCTMRGLRYNQIAVVTRGLDRYTGILDAVLESYNIPHFFSVREPLSAKPLYRLVLGALDVLRNNWKLEDVTAYIKTGLVDIADKDRDTLLGYLERWNIYGSRWTDPTEWNMNPDGYTDQLSQKSKDILKVVSDTRWSIYKPLDTLRAAFHDHTTVREALTALVVFLETLRVPEKVRELGDATATQHYNGLMRSFDQIDAVAGTLPINISMLSQLLNCVVTHTDMGSIPSFVDQVLIGDAALLRASNVQHAFLIGANDGAFPKSVTDSDLFSDLERIQLETHGVITVDSISARTNDELFYAYRACTLPSSSLTITYHTHDFLGNVQHPSILVDRALTLFSDCAEIDDSTLHLIDRVYDQGAALSDAFLYKNTEEGAVLYDMFASDPTYTDRMTAFEAGLLAQEDTIPSTELAHADNIVLSQTRFESFVKCPFHYHCKYTLKLASAQRSDFSSLETGNFVHRILELVLRKLHDGKRLRTNVPEAELEQLLDDEINTFIDLVVGGQGSFTKRMQNLFRKLRQSILLLLQNILEEFAQSKFTPQFFEMDMSEEANPYVIELPDKTKITFRGKVDRVDTYVTEDKKVYLRVVDYKTGAKHFSLSDVMLGINLQMLIYLFGLWNDPPTALRERVGDSAHDMEYLPAGVLYHIARTAPAEGQIDTPCEDAVGEIKRNIDRDGLLLQDEGVLRAMEADLARHYIPVTVSTLKRGSSSLKTLEEFGALQRQVNDIVASIVAEMKKGSASASPLAEQEPCRYCEYVAVCRAKKSRAMSDRLDPEKDATATPDEE